jgi:transposase
MELSTKIEILECYILSGKSDLAALREYKKRHHLIKDPFSASTIHKLMEKFYETGSLLDKPKSGRPPLTTETVAFLASEIQSTSGVTSVRQLAEDTGIPKSSVHRCLKNELKLWPYKMTLHQSLKDEDYAKRLEFGKWLQNHDADICNILWSDEANISLHGNINTHNCRIWASSNPHIILSEPLHSPHLCVWMGFNSQFGLIPYFFETSTVNSENYHSMLANHAIPQLKQHHAFKKTFFMHDGAPPHYAVHVRNFLNEQFPDRVIGRGFCIPWPPRSPDLNPLDYWFWGWLKSKVFPLQLMSIDHLKERITDTCKNITSDEYSAAVSHIYTRIDLLKQVHGGIFEHHL